MQRPATTAPRLVLLAALPVSGEDSPRQKIEELVATYHAQGRFTGSVMAATDGEVVYSGGVGLANVEWDIPNASDTRFRLGSITKQFTAAVIL